MRHALKNSVHNSMALQKSRPFTIFVPRNRTALKKSGACAIGPSALRQCSVDTPEHNATDYGVLLPHEPASRQNASGTKQVSTMFLQGGQPVARPLRALAVPPRASTADKYAFLTVRGARPALSAMEMMPTTPHAAGAELYSLSNLPSTPDMRVRFLFAPTPVSPIRASQLLVAYPALQSAVVRGLLVDCELFGLKRLFIFDSLSPQTGSAALRGVTHLHIDIAAAHGFYALVRDLGPSALIQYFASLRFFSITVHIEDAAHYNPLVSSMLNWCPAIERAVMHVVYDDSMTVVPSFSTANLPYGYGDRLHFTLKNSYYNLDAVELWKRDAWGAQRGVWSA